jgi:hypothetical protein
MHAAASAAALMRAHILASTDGSVQTTSASNATIGRLHRKGLDRLVLIRAFGAHGQQATYHAVAMARGDSDPGVC